LAMKTKSPEMRFWNKVATAGDKQCWIWMGATNGKYGILGAGGRNKSPVYAHRVSWEIRNGKIPNGMYVLHSCDTPDCVNPNHLFLGTQKDNMLDCVKKKRHVSGYGIVSLGRRNSMAKLRDDQVRSLRRMRKSGCSLKYLSKRFGIAFQTVSKIARSDRYKDVQTGEQDWT